MNRKRSIANLYLYGINDFQTRISRVIFQQKRLWPRCGAILLIIMMIKIAYKNNSVNNIIILKKLWNEHLVNYVDSTVSFNTICIREGRLFSKQSKKINEHRDAFFLLGSSLASEFCMPTFRNTLFHLHRQVSAYEDGTVFRNVGI